MIRTEPELKVGIYSRAAFDTEERAREMVDYLMAQPHFAPNKAGEYEPHRRLTPKRIEQAVASLAALDQQKLDPKRILARFSFVRSRNPSCRFSIEWNNLPHEAFSLSSYRVEDSFVRKAEQLEAWLEFAVGLLERHEAWYAPFCTNEEWVAKNFLEWRTTGGSAPSPKYRVTGSGRGVGAKLEEGIPGIFWGNYFGPFYVDWFGRRKFDDLPCVEKLWLDTGGIFFTTSATPFDWNTPAARQMQQAVLEHLGQDAFFDSETVIARVRQLEPIPHDFKPEQFQTPRRLPDFPFTVEPPRSQRKPIEEQLADARQTFEGQGYTLIEEDEKTLLFQDDEGGILRVTVGVGGTVEFLPGQERPTQRPQPTPETKQPDGVSNAETISKSASALRRLARKLSRLWRNV